MTACDERVMRLTREVEAVLDASLAHPGMYGRGTGYEQHILLLLQFRAALVTSEPFPSSGVAHRWRAFASEWARASGSSLGCLVVAEVLTEADLCVVLAAFVVRERGR